MVAGSEATKDLDQRTPMDEVSARFQRKSDQIRALAKAGYSRSEIARHLHIRYQHVRNVLVDDERAAKANQPKPGLSDTCNLASSAKRLDPSKSRVDADGRIAIPPDFLHALGLNENDAVILTVEEDAIRLMSLPASIRRAQAYVRQFVPAGVSLVDELLAERREEAKREDENG
jgi:bifunctional DNA-binding transcriptional regulator/antitoxin component of YhaV-PrlF toxin-antitoxin module